MRSISASSVLVHGRRIVARLVMLGAAATLIAALPPAPVAASLVVAPPSAPADAASVHPGWVVKPLPISTDWPQYRHDPTGAGWGEWETTLSVSTVPHLGVAWKGDINSGSSNAAYRVIDSSPAVANGVVYVGSHNSGKLYAYSVGCDTGGATCPPLWTATTDNWWFASSPAVYNGVVYVESAGAIGGHLFAFDAAVSVNCGGAPKTCNPLWTAAVGGLDNVSSPTVYDGKVYVGSTNHDLYAFDAAGSVNCGGAPKTCNPLWYGATGGAIHSSPAVATPASGANPDVYIGSDDGKLYAWDTIACAAAGGSCSPLWAATPSSGSGIASAPAVVDGVVYVDVNTRLYAYNAAGTSAHCGGSPRTCTPLWSASSPGGAGVVASPAVANGVVYFGATSGYLSAVSASTGASLWQSTFSGGDFDHYLSSPAVANGVVYVADDAGHLHAYDADGATGCSGSPKVCAPVWTFTTGAAIEDSPAVANGVVYVGSDDGKLYAFELPLDHLVLNPAKATIESGGSYAFTAHGVDVHGNSLGDLTNATTFTVSGGGSCDVVNYAYCTATVAGAHTVTGTIGTVNGNIKGTATLNVTGFPYHPVTPARVLDTRKAIGLSGKLKAGIPRTFQVSGQAGVPAGAVAVTGNATVVNSSAASSIYLGPVAIAKPKTYTMSFNKGQIANRGVTLALSPSGALSVTYMAASGTTDLVLDISGYFSTASGGDTYHPLTPARLLDTRTGNGLSGKLKANTPRTFKIWGRGGVPKTAKAVTGNVTVVNSTNAWAIYLGPAPVTKPGASTINFLTGQIAGNSLTVALSSSGTLSATYMSGSGNTTDLVFDVTGFYTADATGTVYVPMTPTSLLDTRTGVGLSGKFSANSPRTFTVRGHAGVPTTATGITGVVSVTGQTAPWALGVGPTPATKPTTSALNFLKGDVCSNGVTVALSSTGTLSLTYMAGAGNKTDVVLYVTGYFVK